MYKIIYFIFILISSGCQSANILAIFPNPSLSHQIVFRPLMHALAKRGHQVTVVTTDPAFPKGKNPQNLTEIDVHDISYKIWNDFLKSERRQEHDPHLNLKYAVEVLNEIFEKQLKSPEIKELIHNRDKVFDLLFIETCMRPALIFSHIYKVPVIEMSSFGGIYETFESTGAPTNILFYPVAHSERFNNLSVREKILMLYAQYKGEQVYSGLVKEEEKMLQKIFGPNIPGLRELKKNVQMFFLNVHPIWDFNRPVPPNIIYLGGLHQTPGKQLPQELQSYLDSSKNGVIYMSFGTNVEPSLLPGEKTQIFANVFSKLPYNVLWKWNTDDNPGRSKNVRTSKWFPQSDLLKHPNVKLFITQGGLQSSDEAITAGVPLIGVPIVGDQFFNTEHYVRLKIGIKLNIKSLTEDILKNAIETILKNDSYRQNVVKVRTLMRDQPQAPLERAVWWTEYLLRHGSASLLQSAAAHKHWTEYYAIDLVLLTISFLVVSLMVIFFSLQYLMSKLKCIQFKAKVQ